MSQKPSDILFQLVQSLEKSEKRHFKLYIKRSSTRQDLKIIRLFDSLAKMKEYDESLILEKLNQVTKSQLANLKIHLYKEVLASLRLLKTTENIDLQLSVHLDNARLLYNKGLHHNALKILDKAKEIARNNQKLNFLVQAISLEKKIETLHITKAEMGSSLALIKEAEQISAHIHRVTQLSNLALLLYRWFITNGHARNEADEKIIKDFFKQQFPKDIAAVGGFYELLYLYQSYCWYAFISQDFLLYYKNSLRWMNLFRQNPQMIEVETGHYIKGIHTLLTAYFDVRNYRAFDETLALFKTFQESPTANKYENFKVHTEVYINIATLNGHLMKGTFKAGLKDIPAMEKAIQVQSLYIDNHRILTFNYKFALIEFGAGNYRRAIDYLNKIIDAPPSLRIDLQCYARLLHLMAHYELNNIEIMESLTKSVYRFLAKMKSLTVVEQEMFKFIKQSFKTHPVLLPKEFKKVLDKVKQFEKNRFETRSFAYLDVISWLESKVDNQPMAAIIHQKYLASKRQ